MNSEVIAQSLLHSFIYHFIQIQPLHIIYYDKIILKMRYFGIFIYLDNLENLLT